MNKCRCHFQNPCLVPRQLRIPLNNRDINLTRHLALGTSDNAGCNHSWIDVFDSDDVTTLPALMGVFPLHFRHVFRVTGLHRSDHGIAVLSSIKLVGRGAQRKDCLDGSSS